jgi:hypothetical protein
MVTLRQRNVDRYVVVMLRFSEEDADHYYRANPEMGYLPFVASGNAERDQEMIRGLAGSLAVGSYVTVTHSDGTEIAGYVFVDQGETRNARLSKRNNII